MGPMRAGEARASSGAEASPPTGRQHDGVVEQIDHYRTPALQTPALARCVVRRRSRGFASSHIHKWGRNAQTPEGCKRRRRGRPRRSPMRPLRLSGEGWRGCGSSWMLREHGARVMHDGNCLDLEETVANERPNQPYDDRPTWSGRTRPPGRRNSHGVPSDARASLPPCRDPSAP